MIAATRQHAGKTSVSMSLLHEMMQQIGPGRVGYMKPIGHKFVVVNGLKVDNDVHMARETFGLRSELRHMSPVVIDQGFTRAYLSGEITQSYIWHKIEEAFEAMQKQYDYLIVEGTGHCGVGSVIGASNAEVAARLGLNMVLVANGGVGSTIDNLNLNRVFCQAHGVTVKGLVITKVMTPKYNMIAEMMDIITAQWGVQLIGVVPFSDRLETPSLLDLEELFDSKLLTGEQFSLAKFHHFELVTSSLRSLQSRFESYKRLKNKCFVTHATRNDIIIGIVSQADKEKDSDSFLSAVLLTGQEPGNKINESVLDFIKNKQTPMLLTKCSTADTMKRLDSIKVKMNAKDLDRTHAVINQYIPFLNISKFLECF